MAIIPMCWFCTFQLISQESQDDCPHVDFECFKLALWPTLRPKFMNFWSFLTRPGDKHDENISNCSPTPKRSWPKLTILPWVSRCFNFSLDKTPNLMVFSEMSFWNEIFLCSIKTEMFTVAESLACVQALHLGDIVKSTRTNGTGEEMRERGKGERSAARFARPNRRACSQATESQVILSRKRRESQAARDFSTVLRDTCRPYVLQSRRNELKYSFNCQNRACFLRIYLSILHK